MWLAHGPGRAFVDTCNPVEWFGDTATVAAFDLEVVQLRNGDRRRRR
jgi:hypothetical protein